VIEPHIRREVEASLGTTLDGVSPVSGGCISPSYRVALSGGAVCFLKTLPAGGARDMFRQEAAALERIASAGALRVPQVMATAESWLALEWLEPAVALPGAWAELGRGLARLHRCRHERYGLAVDNYIGPLPQANGLLASWPAFWAERRLRPQMERATGRLDGALRTGLDRLVDELDQRLRTAEQEGASLLHGDLWGGNVHMTATGAALIDPSSYYGHREVDLAMAALFGGFPPEFEAAYAAEWPLLPGAAQRRAIYQLYYLLVHVNLFGSTYIASTKRALGDALA
jgi:protein-ribulosamine 3-kinase